MAYIAFDWRTGLAAGFGALALNTWSQLLSTRDRLKELEMRVGEHRAYLDSVRDFAIHGRSASDADLADAVAKEHAAVEASWQLHK